MEQNKLIQKLKQHYDEKFNHPIGIKILTSRIFRIEFPILDSKNDYISLYVISSIHNNKNIYNINDDGWCFDDNFPDIHGNVEITEDCTAKDITNTIDESLKTYQQIIKLANRL